MSSPAPVTTTAFLPAPTVLRAAIGASSLAFTLDEVSAAEAAWVARGAAHELDVRTLNVGVAWAIGREIEHSLAFNGDVAGCRGSKGKEEGDEGEELHG